MKEQNQCQQKSLTWEEWAEVNLSGWLVKGLAAAGGLTLMTQNTGPFMVHRGGGRETQRALASQTQCRAAEGGESYQGDKVPADWKNDGGTKEEDYIEIKLCPLDIFPQSQS